MLLIFGGFTFICYIYLGFKSASTTVSVPYIIRNFVIVFLFTKQKRRESFNFYRNLLYKLLYTCSYRDQTAAHFFSVKEEGEGK